jgi:hypothetical protein
MVVSHASSGTSGGLEHMNPSTGLDLYQLARRDDESIFDADGRPLVESRDAELKRCPYPGRRYDRMMNLSALKQMGSHWQEILDAFAFLTTEHMRREHREQTELRDWFAIGSMAVALPSYLLSRPRDPITNHQLPGFVASLMKAAFDVTTTTKLMLARSFVGEPTPTDPQDIAQVAEDASLFISGESGACAGSPKHIEVFLSMLAVPTARARDVSAMHRLVPDTAEMLAYFDPFIAIDGLVLLLRSEATTALQIILSGIPPAGFTHEVAMISEGLARTTTVPRLAGLVSDLTQDAEARGRIFSGFSGAPVMRCPSLEFVADCERMLEAMRLANASQRLRELAARSPRGAQIPTGMLPQIADAVVSYLCVEKTILARLEPLQVTANQALRKAPGRRPSGADVARLLRTPTSVFSMLTGLRIVNRADETKVSLGTEMLVF